MAIDWTKLFRRYKGMWVALADDEITVIAAAPTAKEAHMKSTAKGSSRPFLYRVPDTLDAFVGV